MSYFISGFFYAEFCAGILLTDFIAAGIVKTIRQKNFHKS
jgi:hypothetical protein